MALGLLNITFAEFDQLNIKKVYVKLWALKQRNLLQDVRDRRKAFYAVAPYWSGTMPLQHGWQLWHIPEVDGEVKNTVKYVNVREQTDEEKELVRRMNGN